MTISELIKFLQANIESGKLSEDASIRCLTVERIHYETSYRWNYMNKAEDFVDIISHDCVDFGVNL